jgi:hypothetical protein
MIFLHYMNESYACEFYMIDLIFNVFWCKLNVNYIKMM